MAQQRLFRLAPETIIFQASHTPGYGWRLTVRMRRQSESWSDAYECLYFGLTSSELAQLMADEALTQLGQS